MFQRISGKNTIPGSRKVFAVLGALNDGHLQRAALAAALFISTVCLFASMIVQSSTIDEWSHHNWSESFLDTGNTQRQHQFSTTPITTINVNFARYVSGALQTGRRLFRNRFTYRIKSWINAHELFTQRLPSALWFYACIGGAFVLASHLFGRSAGSLSALLVTLCPSLIANSSLITVDAAFAAAAIWSVYTAIRFCESASWVWFIAMAAAFAFASCIKFTAMILLPGIFMAGIVPFVKRRGIFKSRWTAIPSGILFYIVVALVIGLCYDFKGIRFFLQSYFFKYPLFIAIQSRLWFIPTFLPVGFVEGLDGCFHVENSAMWNVVILDRWYSRGVWFYFPLIYLFKTPTMLIGSHLLGLLRIRKLALTPALVVLLVQIVTSITYFCFFFKTQVGIRYVLFVLPMISVLCSGALARLLNPRGQSALMLSCVAACAINFLPVCNSILSYVNFDFVSKKQPYLYLADSNFDWSQNWTLLGRYNTPEDFKEPSIVQPGRNIYFANTLSGVFWNFNQHLWIRRNLMPAETRAHTFFVFDVSRADYERFLKEERTFREHAPGIQRCANIPSLTEDEIYHATPQEKVYCIRAEKPLLAVFTVKYGKSVKIGNYAPWGECDYGPANEDSLIPFVLEKGTHPICISGLGKVTPAIHTEYPAALGGYF